MLPVYTLGFNIILSDPVPFEYVFLDLFPRSSLALFTCGFTSLITGSGGGGGSNNAAGAGALGGLGGGGDANPSPPATAKGFGENGHVNTGGGAGGSGYSHTEGSAGGSGIVIIRYQLV